MDENLRQNIALFRYSLIAPLITETFTQATAKEYLEEVSAKRYDTPQGSREYAPATIKEWMVFILRLDLIKVNLEICPRILRNLLFLQK